MTIERIGCGAGRRDLDEQPNILRLMVGTSVEQPPGEDQVWVLETNLDDLTGEMIGYCTARLWEAGALDVFTTAIQMKKNRPGVMVSVLCPAETVGAIEAILFEETTTLGVRRWPVSRHVLRAAAALRPDALGPGRRQGGLAGRRRAAVRMRVRVVPQDRPRTRRGVARRVRSGAQSVRSGDGRR